MSILARFRSFRSGAGLRRACVACGVVASLSVCGVAAAQFGPIIDLPPDLPNVQPVPPPEGYPPTLAPTAVGTFFTPPTSGQTLAVNVRFVILSNFNSDAVLDRETGLVWARQSLSRTVGSPTQITRRNVNQFCRLLTVGNRKGWRLPTVAELQTLVDRLRVFQNAPRPPALPVGHPFLLSREGTNPTFLYWTGEAYTDLAGLNRRLVDLTIGQSRTMRAFDSVPSGVDGLCVRGGAGPLDDSVG
ncbi:MAG TPA: DUF1566 domain-containing protein [Steroidobacteraceae bacterium]|nr:DUF1566 domain-containing protein [Steroidobacteraceae bacterium]